MSLKEENIPKHRKLRNAVDALADAIDDALKFGTGPFAEALASVDGIILRGIMRIIIQFAFRTLKNEGSMA